MTPRARCPGSRHSRLPVVLLVLLASPPAAAQLEDMPAAPENQDLYFGLAIGGSAAINVAFSVYDFHLASRRAPPTMAVAGLEVGLMTLLIASNLSIALGGVSPGLPVDDLWVGLSAVTAVWSGILLLHGAWAMPRARRSAAGSTAGGSRPWVAAAPWFARRGTGTTIGVSAVGCF